MKRCTLSPNDPDYDDSFDMMYESRLSDWAEKARSGERLKLIERIAEFPPYDDFEYEFPWIEEKHNWDWWFETHPKDYSAWMANLLESDWPYEPHIAEEIEAIISYDWR